MNQFIVSARKYRPQRFDEVVGQDHITTTLKNAIRQNKVAHAFLFCGPRGVGKTTSARILAKTINCENITEDIEACGQCDSCVAFQKKNAPNIIELDAASHNSVDDIRNLNEQVRIPPAQGKYKIFIIDEVHMLSIAAFNAFLKTLEEPPPSAIFILATTEKHKILPTILSRCQIYDFKRSRVSDIVEHLRKICQSEGLKYDMEALHLIAEKADGALRDALSIFDRMVSFSDGHISYAAVVEQLNVLDYDYFFKLIDHLLAGDLSATYLLFDQILDKGFNPEVFLLGMQEHLRHLLMFHLSDTGGLVNGSHELQQRYAQQSAMASKDFLLTLLDMANDSDVHFRMAQNKRLHVEIMLMKMAYFPYAREMTSQDQLSSGNPQPPSYPVKKNTHNDPYRENAPVNTVSPTASSLPAEESNDSYRAPSPGEDAIPEKSLDSESVSSEKQNVPSYTQHATSNKVQSSPPQKRKSRTLLPTLNDVDEIIEEVNLTNQDHVEIPEGEELLGLIDAAWKDFMENHSSPSLASFMRDAVLAWKDEKLVVTVTSRLARSSILDQRDLFERLREATHPVVPEIVFKIDAQNAATPPPKILTTRDKYEALQKANPKLQDLIQKLNLRIEEI